MPTITALHAGGVTDPKLVFYPVITGETGVTDTLYPYGDVRRHGADPTGAVDATTAIHDARTSASVGGRLTFPDGATFLVSGLVPNVANQHWHIPRGTTIKMVNAGTAPVIDITASGVTVDGGGTIDGNRAGLPTGTTRIGVRARTVSNVTVQGLTIQNCADEAVLGDNVTTLVVANNRISGCQQSLNQKVLHIVDTTGNSTDVLIEGNHVDCTTFNTSGINVSVSTNGRSVQSVRTIGNTVLVGDGGVSYPTLGIEYFTSNGGTIRDSLVANNVIIAPNTTNTQVFGISIGGNATASTTGNVNIAVTGNVIRDCGNVAIEMIGNALSVTGNQCYNCGYCLISATQVTGGSYGVTFVGNELYLMRDTNYALRIDGGSNGIAGFNVSRNTIYKGGAIGIWLFGTLSDGDVSGNVVTQPASHGIVVDGAATLTDVCINDNNIDLTGAAASKDGIISNSTTSAHCEVSRNHIRSATRNGMWFNGSHANMVVQNNVVRACSTNGILFVSGDQWLISGNKTYSNGDTGLSLAAITNAEYYGNRSHNNTNADENYGTATFASFQTPQLTIGGASTGTTVGTPIKQIRVYTPTLTPASVPAQSGNGQTFTVLGLTTADTVYVNPPASSGAYGVSQTRVSAADTLAIIFTNPTTGPLTPTSGVYRIVAIRS